MSSTGKPKDNVIRKPDLHAGPEPVTLESIRYNQRVEGVRLDNETIQELDADQFLECIWNRVNVSGSFRGTRFTDVIFDHCDFSNAVFDETSFVRCQFSQCRMTGISLIEAAFTDVTLEKCTCAYANLNCTRWNRASFDEVLFREAAFGESVLNGVTVQTCDFTGCELPGTSLKDVDLSDSVLQNIMIRPEDIKGAILSTEQAVICAQLLDVKIKY